MATKVLIADDHQILREGLCALLRTIPGVAVLGEAGNGRDAVTLARRLCPDVVLMDISMPGLNGIDATREIRASLPQVRVIALSVHSDRQSVVDMLEAGAQGYVPKECTLDELAGAMRTVMTGNVYLSPGVSTLVVDEYVRHPRPGPADASPALTPREREVLQLLAEGHSTKEIASRLTCGVKTVETHRAHLSAKTGLHSIADLTKYAIRHGLTTV